MQQSDGTNDYELGDVITITTDTNLTPVMSRTLLNVMKNRQIKYCKKCQKYERPF